MVSVRQLQLLSRAFYNSPLRHVLLNMVRQSASRRPWGVAMAQALKSLWSFGYRYRHTTRGVVLIEPGATSWIRNNRRTRRRIR